MGSAVDSGRDSNQTVLDTGVVPFSEHNFHQQPTVTGTTIFLLGGIEPVQWQVFLPPKKWDVSYSLGVYLNCGSISGLH